MGCAIGRLGALVGGKAIGAGRVVVGHAGKYQPEAGSAQSIGTGDVGCDPASSHQGRIGCYEWLSRAVLRRVFCPAAHGATEMFFI